MTPIDRAGAAQSSSSRPPGARRRVRRSLAARIGALTVVLMVASGISALATIGQLRAIQASFDRLIEVYVVFNQRLSDAHMQAVRVHEIIRSHQSRSEFLSPPPIDLDNFRLALRSRSEGVSRAREPIDGALSNPSRYGGEGQLGELRGIRRSLDELEELVMVHELEDPLQVMQDLKTQNRITQLFNALSSQSGVAVDELRQEVRTAQGHTERLTIGLTLATTLLGLLVLLAVFATLRPLRQLAQSVRDLGRGNWTPIRIAGMDRGDEVGQLAAEFNLMARALSERERRLLRGERLAAAGQLAAQITHEIRNPLSAVALNVELLEDELSSSSAEGRMLLAAITKEVDRLTQVTEDYLSFARRPKPERSRVDLAEEIRNLVDFIEPDLDRLGVALEVDLPSEPATIWGDPNQLRQAFMNLIRNAQEAAADDECREMGRTPRVGVRMTLEGLRIRTVITDNGPGIPLSADATERIFEPFFTRKAKGTGLGLPTVQQIVGDHDGSVRVASTSDAGTTFEVWLPRAGLADRSAPP